MRSGVVGPGKSGQASGPSIIRSRMDFFFSLIRRLPQLSKNKIDEAFFPQQMMHCLELLQSDLEKQDSWIFHQKNYLNQFLTKNTWKTS